MVLGLCLAYSWSTSSAVCPWSWDGVLRTQVFIFPHTGMACKACTSYYLFCRYCV